VRLAVAQQGVSGSTVQVGITAKRSSFREASAYVATDFVERGVPVSVKGVSRRPVFAIDRRLTHSRLYEFGSWTQNILLDEHARTIPMSPPAPTITPTVAAAAGPGVTNTSVCYLQWYDSLTGRQSPKSAGVEVVLSNQSRAWTSLPTTGAPPGMDSLRGIVSADGLLARVAWQRQIGATSVTEAVETLSLGDVVEDFSRMPLSTMGVMYLDSLYTAGNREFPERVFKSVLAQPERHEAVFVQTDGEPVVSLLASNNSLLFGSYERIYRLTGVTEFDLKRTVEKPDIGFLSPYAHAHAHGKTIIPTNWGIYLYNGPWTPLLQDRESEWRRHYDLYRADFEQAQGFYDPVENVFTFGPVPHLNFLANGEWVEWVLNCRALFTETADGTGGPGWGMDVRSRKIVSKAVLFVPGSGERYVASGACDGKKLWPWSRRPPRTDARV